VSRGRFINLDPTLYQVSVDSLQVNFRELDQHFLEQLFDEFLPLFLSLFVSQVFQVLVSDIFVSVGLQVLV